MSRLAFDTVAECTRSFWADPSHRASYRPAEPYSFSSSIAAKWKEQRDILPIDRVELVQLLVIQLLGFIPTIFFVLFVAILGRLFALALTAG
jgi:hypothetical protein